MSFPNEIWAHIFAMPEIMGGDEGPDKDAILSLLLTSKAFNAIMRHVMSRVVSETNIGALCVHNSLINALTVGAVVELSHTSKGYSGNDTRLNKYNIEGQYGPLIDIMTHTGKLHIKSDVPLQSIYFLTVMTELTELVLNFPASRTAIPVMEGIDRVDFVDNDPSVINRLCFPWATEICVRAYEFNDIMYYDLGAYRGLNRVIYDISYVPDFDGLVLPCLQYMDRLWQISIYGYPFPVYDRPLVPFDGLFLNVHANHRSYYP